MSSTVGLEFIYALVEEAISGAVTASHKKKGFNRRRDSSDDEGIGSISSAGNSVSEGNSLDTSPVAVAYNRLSSRLRYDDQIYSEVAAIYESLSAATEPDRKPDNAAPSKQLSPDSYDWTASTSAVTPADEDTLYGEEGPAPYYVHFGAVGSSCKRQRVYARPADRAPVGASLGRLERQVRKICDSATKTALSNADDLWTARGLVDLDRVSPCTQLTPCAMDKILLVEAEAASKQLNLYDQLSKIVTMTERVVGDLTKSGF